LVNVGAKVYPVPSVFTVFPSTFPSFCPQSALTVTAMQASHQFIFLLFVFTGEEEFPVSFSFSAAKEQFISPPSWQKKK